MSAPADGPGDAARASRGGGAARDEAEQTETPGLAARAAYVFMAPGRLFDALRTSPAWLGMLVLVVVLSLVGGFLIPQEVWVDSLLAQLPTDAPPEAVESARGRAEALYGLRFVFSLLFPVATIVFVAGLLLFLYNVVLGGEARFGQLFSATTHAFLVVAVGGLITVPIIRASGDIEAAFALHLLVPGLDDEGFLFRVLKGITVFGVWTSVLLGIAVSRIYRRREAGAAIATVLGLYLAMKLAGAVLGGIAM